jgi:hypothetical protein
VPRGCRFQGARRAPNAPLPSLFLVTLIRSTKSQEIFKLNNLNDIIVKVELHRAQTGFKQCYSFQKLAISVPIASYHLGVCGGHMHKEYPDKKKEENVLQAPEVDL